MHFTISRARWQIVYTYLVFMTLSYLNQWFQSLKSCGKMETCCFLLKTLSIHLADLETESKLWLNKQESSRTKQFCWDFFLMPKMQGVYGISYKENIFEKTNLNEPEWLKINKKWIPTTPLNENCSFPTRKLKTERERERERERVRDKIQIERKGIN